MLSTVSELSAVRRAVTVQSAALKTLSLAALDAVIASNGLAKVASFGSFVACALHQPI